MSEFHNLLVTGGRGYANRMAVAKAFRVALRVMNEQFGVKPVRLHHGGAKGADSLAADYATVQGWEVVAYHADWGEHGRAAGPIRNRQMVDWSNAVLCISFPGGTGTADCVKRAVEAGIPHYAVPSKKAKLSHPPDDNPPIFAAMRDTVPSWDELETGIRSALNGND